MINNRDQGRIPSRSNRNCGSKLNRLPETERFIVAAGFPNENRGTNENPLLVRFIFPDNCICLGFAGSCAKTVKEINNDKRKVLFNSFLDPVRLSILVS